MQYIVGDDDRKNVLKCKIIMGNFVRKTIRYLKLYYYILYSVSHNMLHYPSVDSCSLLVFCTVQFI